MWTCWVRTSFANTHGTVPKSQPYTAWGRSQMLNPPCPAGRWRWTNCLDKCGRGFNYRGNGAAVNSYSARSKMGTATIERLISPEEYLAAERVAEEKSEYFDGRVVAMAGA